MEPTDKLVFVVVVFNPIMETLLLLFLLRDPESETDGGNTQMLSSCANWSHIVSVCTCTHIHLGVCAHGGQKTNWGAISHLVPCLRQGLFDDLCLSFWRFSVSTYLPVGQ